MEKILHWMSYIPKYVKKKDLIRNQQTQCAQEVKSENSQTIKGMTPLIVDTSIKYRRNHKLVGA